jgi:hypothetical protein
VTVRRSLLVYDGSTSLFRAAAERATAQSDDVRAVRWDADPVQAFLQAQFDDRPFAFIVVDGDTVHAGDATVEWLLERTGVATTVVDGLTRAYATGGGAVGRLVHGRAVADLNGTFELTDDAAASLQGLRQVHEIPVHETSTDAP